MKMINKLFLIVIFIITVMIYNQINYQTNNINFNNKNQKFVRILIIQKYKKLENYKINQLIMKT